jgi:death-on-curing protein
VKEPRWLTKAGVLAMHHESIEIFGGAHGIRDEGRLESALDRPKNKWHYGVEDTCTLAAAYAFGVSRNHPFIDGNKRTAFLAMTVFLLKSGLKLTATEADAYKEMIRLAAGASTEEELAEWIRANVQPAA